MVQPVVQVCADRSKALLLPAIVRLFQSGAIPDDKLIEFFFWLDSVIRNGKSNERVDVEHVLESVFGPSKAAELAAKVRTTATSATPSSYSKEKPLTGYLKLDKPIVFLDVETAGWHGDRHRIVEISLVKFHVDGKVEPLSLKINPEVPIPKDSTNAHGIKDEDVKNCPTFKEVAPSLYEYLGDCHLGGFNIFTFDFNALVREFQAAGLMFAKGTRAVIDPMLIYHKKVKAENGKPRTLVNAYKYYCDGDLENTHTSDADVLATVEVLKGQFEMYPELPRDVYKLSSYCFTKRSDFVDQKGKFKWAMRDGKWEVVFNFSKKHPGQTLREVVETDRGFLEWMLKEDFPEDTKELVRNAIDGKYPEPPVA